MIKFPWSKPSDLELAEWHEYTLPWRNKPTGMYGEKLNVICMRRLVKSDWQYRNMTQAEVDDLSARMAW